MPSKARPRKAAAAQLRPATDWRTTDADEILKRRLRAREDKARVEDLSRPLIREFLTEVGSDLAAQADTLPLPDLARQLQIARGTP